LNDGRHAGSGRLGAAAAAGKLGGADLAGGTFSLSNQSYQPHLRT
jgi:hypothetical protein